MSTNRRVRWVVLPFLAAALLLSSSAAGAAAGPSADVSWQITNSFLSYTLHGKIAAHMDYLWVGPLMTSPSGTTTINLTNFNPSNVFYESEGGASCGYSSLKVVCTGVLSRLHITFDYDAGTTWVDPYFYNYSAFGYSIALDMTYIVTYTGQFSYDHSEPDPTSDVPGQVTWSAASVTSIEGGVMFIEPTLYPQRAYLPMIVR